MLKISTSSKVGSKTRCRALHPFSRRGIARRLRLLRWNDDVSAALFPHVAENGILIADGYPAWDFYAQALHEYLAGYEGVARIKQFEDVYYVVKGARKWEDSGSQNLK